MTRPAQLQKRMQKRFAVGVQSMHGAHKELIKGGKEDHAQYTSGRVPTKTLRAMGHPFGRKVSGDERTGVRGIREGYMTRETKSGRFQSRLSRHAKAKGNSISKGVLNPLPINKQTGKLRASFFQTPPTGADLRVDMGYASPYAAYVLSPTGTHRMVARGFYSVRPNNPPLAGLGIVAKRHRARKAGIIAGARRNILFMP